MRYIGNKTNLLNNINQVIKENCDGNEKIFCDLFSGTSSVARFFKTRYKMIFYIFLMYFRKLLYIIMKYQLLKN